MPPQQRNPLLKIPSVLYGWGVTLRNVAYDNGWLKTKPSPLPTICVGNLSAGGTGKTPHIEFLVKRLSGRYRLAVLSRGYGRADKKPREVQPEDSVAEVGDEPLQIKRKFPELTVYVDGDRCRALETLAARGEKEKPELVLMDDGYQHRSLKPDYSILLTAFEAPFTRDELLPYGRLREPQEGKYRANAVILTKAPIDVRPIDFTLLKGEMELHAHQLLLYSHLKQLSPQPIVANAGDHPQHLAKGAALLVVLGIAQPDVFLRRCQREGYKIKEERIFKDHHCFSRGETDQFRDALEMNQDLYLLCTEKDAVRLKPEVIKWPESIRKRAFYMPIEISMKQEFIYHLFGDIDKVVAQARRRLY